MKLWPRKASHRDPASTNTVTGWISTAWYLKQQAQVRGSAFLSGHNWAVIIPAVFYACCFWWRRMEEEMKVQRELDKKKKKKICPGWLIITFHLSCLCHFPVQMQIFRRIVEKERKKSNLPLIRVISKFLYTLTLHGCKSVKLFMSLSIRASQLLTLAHLFLISQGMGMGGVQVKAMNEWEREKLNERSTSRGWLNRKSRETLWNKSSCKIN